MGVATKKQQVREEEPQRTRDERRQKPSFMVAGNTIAYGTQQAPISGKLTARGRVPKGKVMIKLGSNAPQPAEIQQDGYFSAMLNTSVLQVSVSPYPITFQYGKNDDFEGAEARADLVVNKVPLTVTADDQERNYGYPNPPFTATFSGFVNGEDSSDLSGSLSLSTPATDTSPPNTYPITPSGVSSTNYDITFMDGVLTVDPGLAVFASFDPDYKGSAGVQQVIPNVTFQCQIGSAQKTSASTDADGRCFFPVGIPIDKPQLVTIIPPPSVDFQGINLRSAAKGPILVQVEPGMPSTRINVSYYKGLAELWVQANLQLRTNEPPILLPGVEIRLYKGSPPSDQPLRKIVTSASAPAVISDLEEGTYNLFVAASGLHYQGKPVELADPANAWLTQTVVAGQRIHILDRIKFVPAVGRLSVVVTDANSGRGLEGVPLLAVPAHGNATAQQGQSDVRGEAVFEGLAPGQYTVKLANREITLSPGVNWVPKGESTHEVYVRATKTTQAPEFQLVEDTPRIVGAILDDDGNEFAFAEVLIYDASGNKVLASVITDEHGRFNWIAPSKGVYYIGPKQDESGGTITKKPVTVRSTATVMVSFPRRGGTGMAGSPTSNKQIREAFTDLAAYPILTEEVGYPPSPLATPSGTQARAPAGTQLGQIAMKAVADVLGWKAKTDDPKGFLGALTQSFTLTDVEGHVESKWVPRTYAVQTDLSGGITGAQASIYSRAKDALDQSLPLLDGLYAFDPEADPEFVTALREVVRSQMTELINELGYSGGPRVSRVNQYFSMLLGLPPTLTPSTQVQPEPDKVGGTLGNLRNVYGIATLIGGKPNPLVNTVEDEQNTTNFRVLSDYLTSLAQSWINNLSFFGLAPTGIPFLGTQLVLISRQLSVTSELVDDVRFALDSVFIGPSERQTLQINFSTGDPPLFVEDLLGWIQRFASEEGPNMIQTGGKFGVYQVVQVVTQLQKLTTGAINPTNKDVPQAYFSPRVRRALAALADQLQDLISIATPVATSTLPSNP